VYRIGLTGGIGSGKSEVARVLRGLGARVVVADEIARELVAPGSPVLEGLVEAFGEGVLLPDGSLDRRGLGALAFASSDALERLNEITHPALVEAIILAVEEIERESSGGVVVVDAALLVKWDILDLFDEVVVVTAALDARIGRLAAGGLPEDDARERVAAQAPESVFLEAADTVIENNGPLEELETRAEQLWNSLPEEVRKGT